MDPDKISVRVPFARRNRIIGKGFVVVIVGLLFGVLAAQSDREDLERARGLTLEKYTADYETYKASLTKDKWGMVPDIGLVLFATGLFFGLYEATGMAVGVMVGQFSDDRDRSGESARPFEG